MDELKRQDPPGVVEPGNVEKASGIEEETSAKDLCVANAFDEIDAVEVSRNLTEVVDHTRQTVQRRRATEVLQVPEEKGEDQADPEAHEPGDKKESKSSLVVHRSQNSHPIRNFSRTLGIHSTLLWLQEKNVCELWIKLPLSPLPSIDQ